MTTTVYNGRVIRPNNGSPSTFTYTNSTGGNVRVIIYWFYGGAGSGGHGMYMKWGDLSGSDHCTARCQNDDVFGKHVNGNADLTYNSNVPTEMILSNGQSWKMEAMDSAGWGEYSIAVITEA